MAKGIQKFKIKKNSKKNVVPGDVYQLSTDITLLDIDADGANDLTFTHQVDKNGENWVDAKIVWYGLPPEVSQAFVDALSDVGFIDDEVITTDKIGIVVKHWKNLTKALAKINKLGDTLVVALGEEVED